MTTEDIEVRDTRNGEWAWVYNAVISDPHLSASDVRVYGALSSFGGYQITNPSIKQIAERGQMSIRQAKVSIKKLEEIEYISIEKGQGRGNSNVYYLLKKPKGCKICTISKGCRKEQEKVQKTTIKGAESAPTINIAIKINKDKESITPAQQAKEFFLNASLQETTVEYLMSKGITGANATREVKKFISYWTEPNKSGTKQRWELEKTFDVKRRLVTWFGNAQRFNGSKPIKQGLTI